MIWKPLIEEEQSGELHEKLYAICEVVRTIEDNQPNLFCGAPGLALFLFYLGRATGDEVLLELGMKRIGTTWNAVDEKCYDMTFAAGLSGLAWTIVHLAKHDFIESDFTDVLEDLTEPFRCRMIDCIKKNEYDYLHGALGIALYFLERPEIPQTRLFLQELIDLFLAGAEPDAAGGLKWEIELDFETRQRGYNLSLSHGQAGIIDILGRMVHAGFGGETAVRLLEGALFFLLRQEFHSTKRKNFFFPSWVVSGRSYKGGRLAWCYGDLGLGQVLLHTGQRLGRIELQEKGLAILKHTLLFKHPQEAGITDAGLCHGTAGLAHIYNRLWQETGESCFAQAAQSWFQHTLQMANFEDGLAGFKAHRAFQNRYENESGLLEGVAGIGLSIISALYAQEPSWDRALLLS